MYVYVVYVRVSGEGVCVCVYIAITTAVPWSPLAVDNECVYIC